MPRTGICKLFGLLVQTSLTTTQIVSKESATISGFPGPYSIHANHMVCHVVLRMCTKANIYAANGQVWSFG